MFSMQKVLEYKKHAEDSEKALLSQMRSRHEALCAQLLDLKKEYGQLTATLEEMYKDGVEIRKAMAVKRYSAELAERAGRLMEDIERLKTEIEGQVDRVMAITREKNSMEKLKGKRYLLYRNQVQKETELFIDNFVANARFSTARQVG